MRGVSLVLVGALGGAIGCTGAGSSPFTERDAAPLDASDVAAVDAPTPEAGACARASECDDGIPCTEDSCVVGGVCEHVPDDGLCPAGERCIPGRGCRSSRTCTAHGDCDDRVDCTQDLCVMERLGVRIDDDGFTREDPKGKVMNVATAWRDLGAFEDLVVRRVTGAR